MKERKGGEIRQRRGKFLEIKKPEVKCGRGREERGDLWTREAEKDKGGKESSTKTSTELSA